jgi:hypothetical protein
LHDNKQRIAAYGLQHDQVVNALTCGRVVSRFKSMSKGKKHFFIFVLVLIFRVGFLGRQGFFDC